MCKVYIVICKVCGTQYTVHSTQYTVCRRLTRPDPGQPAEDGACRVGDGAPVLLCVHSVQTVQQVSTLLSFKRFFIKERYCEVRVWTQSLRVETWLQVRGRKWRENDGPIIQHVPQTRHRHHNLQQRFTFTKALQGEDFDIRWTCPESDAPPLSFFTSTNPN